MILVLAKCRLLTAGTMVFIIDIFKITVNLASKAFSQIYNDTNTSRQSLEFFFSGQDKFLRPPFFCDFIALWFVGELRLLCLFTTCLFYCGISQYNYPCYTNVRLRVFILTFTTRSFWCKSKRFKITNRKIKSFGSVI